MKWTQATHCQDKAECKSRSWISSKLWGRVGEVWRALEMRRMGESQQGYRGHLAPGGPRQRQTKNAISIAGEIYSNNEVPSVILS